MAAPIVAMAARSIATRVLTAEGRAAISSRFAGGRLTGASNLLRQNKAKESIAESINQSMSSALQNAGNSIQPVINVDTREFESAIIKYAQLSGKEFKDIVNQKAYWIALGAFRETYKADKTVIKSNLDAQSTRMPGLTVGEAIIVDRERKKGLRHKINVIKTMAKKLANRRASARGFLSSGWLPAIKALSAFVDKKFTAGYEKATRRGKPKGGGKPAVNSTVGGVTVASVWNDIKAGDDAKAKSYMEVGLQKGLNKEAASMLQYVEKKLAKLAQGFNR